MEHFSFQFASAQTCRSLLWKTAPRQILKPVSAGVVGDREGGRVISHDTCDIIWICDLAKPCGTTGSVDTSSNNTQLFCCVKHKGCGEGGGAAEHYAKICTISTVVRWALAAVVCTTAETAAATAAAVAAAPVLASWFAPSPTQASLCVTALWEGR